MTMTLISTVTLGSAAANIELTSIPGTFTDLLITASLRSAWANNIEGLLVAFNGSTSNFTWRNLEGNGSSASSGSSSVGRAGVINANSSTSNTFGSMRFYIPNYAGSTNKSYSVESVTENNATFSWQELTAGLWSNTAAITSIRFTPDQGNNLLTGSTMSVYGILKGSGGATVS